jgi:hypothetical protein
MQMPQGGDGPGWSVNARDEEELGLVEALLLELMNNLGFGK